MTDLKRLADEVRGCDMLDDDRDYLATLLRSAAGETVGTLLVEIGYAEACNNRNVYACRLALAAARKERDEAVAECERHRNDAFREADACRTITAERAALQRAIDEAIIFVEGHLTDENRRKLLAATLRPHATPSQPERKWSSTPPSDRSGKWWNAFGFECSDQCLHLVPNTMTWDQAENGDDWGYDLWLPYVEGDTRDSLPPLPNSSATVTSSPAPAPRPCDCRELVARLTECVEALASRRVFPHFLRDIIRDARGGGA